MNTCNQRTVTRRFYHLINLRHLDKLSIFATYNYVFFKLLNDSKGLLKPRVVCRKTMLLREKPPFSKVAIAETALKKKLEALLEEALVAGFKTLLVASLTDAALSVVAQVDVETICKRYLLVRYVLEVFVSLYHALCSVLSVLHALYTGVQEVACAAHHVVRILQHGVETLRSAWLVVSCLLRALVHVGRALWYLFHCLAYLLYLLLVFSH